MVFPDTIHRPHMPLADAVDQLSADIDHAREDPTWWKNHQPPHILRPLIRDFEVSHRAEQFGDGTSASFTETAEAFCAHAHELSVTVPGATALAAAPTLNPWCALREEELCYLVGRVTGHPHVQDSARCRTSNLFRITPDAGWARTWNRFYKLGMPNPLFFLELQCDRRISSSAEINWDIIDLQTGDRSEARETHAQNPFAMGGFVPNRVV